MRYEVYIQEPKKVQKFCKKAIAEYEKRLSRYCKISCKFIKKDKEWETLLKKDTGMKKFLVKPGKANLTSEHLSRKIKDWDGSGIKGVQFFVPEYNEENPQEKESIESLVLSDFTMSSNMTGMVLYEQIYRGYRILNNHPYHK